MKSGQTVVLGGIYRETFNDTVTGIPFLKDIPGLGWLFRSDDKEKRREDLLVFLSERLAGSRKGFLAWLAAAPASRGAVGLGR